MSGEEERYQTAVLVLPQLRVQNANAISSPMTWGFPSITAFVGMMHALERRLKRGRGLEFLGVGVICHDFMAQATEGGYTRAFHLTRNPLICKSGQEEAVPAAIVEEGRIHLDLTLVFLVNVAASHWAEGARAELAQHVNRTVADMRIAGGSVLPASVGDSYRRSRPQLQLLPDDKSDRGKHFRRLRRRWVPGFALVDRTDLLHAHIAELRQDGGRSTEIDAWLDLSRLNHHAERSEKVDNKTGEVSEDVAWVTEHHEGWRVPIPVGYVGLSDLYAPGSVANTRDVTTPFRFVESVYSIGQWVSPHRLADVNDLLWYSRYDKSTGLYRCQNDYSWVPSDMALSSQDD